MSDDRPQPYLMQGPWELDPKGKTPALYIDAADGGDPLIVASIKRIYRPDVLQAMGLPLKLDPPPDELARLRAEVERLRGQAEINNKMVKKTANDVVRYKTRAERAEAALSDERAHADALARALHGIMGAYSEPDRRICCNGHMCGCRGSTVREMEDHYAAEALEAHRARRQG